MAEIVSFIIQHINPTPKQYRCHFLSHAGLDIQCSSVFQWPKNLQVFRLWRWLWCSGARLDWASKWFIAFESLKTYQPHAESCLQAKVKNSLLFCSTDMMFIKINRNPIFQYEPFSFLINEIKTSLYFYRLKIFQACVNTPSLFSGLTVWSVRTTMGILLKHLPLIACN